MYKHIHLMKKETFFRGIFLEINTGTGCLLGTEEYLTSGLGFNKIPSNDNLMLLGNIK